MHTSMETAPKMALREPDAVRCAPQRPFNESLQAEAITYLMHEREADASAELSKGGLHSLAMRREQTLVPPELLMELKDGEQADASVALPEKLNPCTCTTAAFDEWLRAVVKSIPAPAEAADAVQRRNCCGSRTICGRARPGGVTGVSRQQALYRALEVLEAATRLLQRHAVLCRGRSRLLHAYYDALEEDIHQHAVSVSASTATRGTVQPTAEIQLQQLLPPEQHKYSPFHYHLRLYKRGAPLHHYTQEQEKLQSRLEKVYYVLLKLEEVEGLSNSILVEGQATSLLAQQRRQSTDALQGGSTKAGSIMRANVRKDGIGAGSSADLHDALTLTGGGGGGGARGDGESEPAMNEPTLQFSRRLVGMERRVRRLRQQLRLPLPVSEVTSRLRNELILSFSARVLALREPAPFTSEIYVTSAAPAASPSPQAAPRPPGDGAHHQSSHSISAFVEWYVQRVMDPLAISQLLSIVPREYVVTTTCRLVYACEAHASLRSSRALPDLGPVLLRAVAEGRADAVAQLLLSSSVSYGSVLSHPVDCHTCFFAGLLGGQIDVLARLVEQQSWNVNALHVLLFMSAPWNIAAAPTAVMSSRGCYVYQQALVERVQAFLSVAEQVLAARSQEPAYKLPLSLEENATDAASMSTIAGGADYEADESALAALRKAQLLDVSAEGEKLLAALGCFLGSAAASASINDDALRGGRHGSQRSTHAGKPVTTANASMARGGGMKKKAEDASDADDDGITGSTGVSAFGALSMSAASRAAPPLPPVFLKGALHRLQLFLAVRNAMLQYERQRQDAQWETLLGKVKARPSSGDGASSAAASTMHGLGSSGKNLARLHAKAPPLLQGAAAANPRTDHREAPLASAVAAPYSFVQILQQHQLDALTAGALCPLRCQMCPAFTTPQLQRVDAWSYGPLQPTTAITTALGTARGTGNEGGAKHSSRELISLAERVNTLIGIGEDDCRPDENLRGRLNRSLSSLSPRSRPITALLMRSDTAIDMMASSWYVHANISQANFVEEHGHYGSSSNGNGERQTARGAHLHRLMNPWQARSATGLLMSALPFRYSLSMPLEDVRRAAQDAKQRRALRTLYGSSAAGAADKSVSDHDDGGDRSDDHHPRRGGTGTAAENLASLYVHRATPPPAKPSFYYEVQMSVEYLVAMHAADYLGATPLAIGSEALARGASSPLSEDAMHRLCENCVIVGLCNPITAAQANGCTHSPSQPYVVTHLGHECGAGGAAQDKERGGSGSGAWSAGVSVSVIAHEKVAASRLLSACVTAHASPATATAAVVEPGEASTTPSDDDADIDVLYLGVWKHQRNSVRAVTAMQASPHHVDGDAADACANAAPVYLRLELPRWSHPAPAKEAGTTAAQDAPRDRVAAANGNPAHAAETNAATAAATASTNMWLPIITRACQDDVTRAVAKARQQQQAEAAQGTAANQASERARKSRCGATSPSLPASPFASLTRVRCEVAATLVLGLLLDPSAGTLRLRLNNYTDFEEITLGLWLGSVAEATAATASAPPPPPAPKPRLYPAATLSLNDCGWRSWRDHQTRKWAKQQQQQGVQPTGLTSGERRVRRAPVEYSAPPSSASSPSSLLSVSNAVLRFSFDAAELLFGPPPPRQAVRITSADAIMPAGKAARMSHQQRRVSEPIGAKAPHSVVPPFQASQPIALLDSTVKFTEMLSVLTDVSLLAATKRSGDKNQQQQQLHSLGHGDDAADEDEEGEVDGVDATAPQGAAPPAHSSLLLIGSRDRRTHAAMMRVQRLLNTPGGGATGTTAGSSSAFNNSDPADIFYPPVRIYRHSCHCPAHELYPLPSSSSLGAADKDDASERSRRTQKCQRCLANRRIGLSSAGETSSLFSTNVYWHDIIPENARLTPLCAALASRQRAMAYVIATHPLTCFCNLSVDEESACDAYARQQQPQQRRAALYAACALGYMEVVQVLLERIPVEELLSYFGLVIESEARAALQRCYAVANTVFLRNYRLRSLATQSPSSPSGGTAVETSAPAVPYLSNESQRALLDASAIYYSSRSTYTPLHVALLGVVLENGDQDDEGVEEGSYVDVDTEEARMSSLNARLGKQTACVTVLLNCLYDLLCVASASNTTARKAQNTAELVHPPHSTKSHGREEDVLGGEAQARRPSSAGRELLVDALNLQSPTGEAALLIAVRHNNVAVALRLLKLGAQPACMDRITRLLSLELACANRCTPIAEALLQSHNGGGAVYATSPVLLNHAGIATALCWCAINNMPAIMQKLLECDGIDAESGFEGSSPLHLAIAFGSEAAALTLLNGTQPRKTATISARKGSGGRAEAPPAALVAAATAAPDTKTASLAAKHVNCGSSQRGTAAPSASPARPTETVSAAETHKKPFMDVNILHERTHCTPLHLACERGQLRIIRTLLQSWHAQLNIAAAYTNYTPLLTAVANGQEEAALRILEYSKDELRRGRAVLDLCAIDQHGDTALHLAASRGLNLAVEYMLVQFSEEEVARLVALHPTLRASPAYQAATCIVPLHAVNKHGKTALLVALQYNQADTAELLVSMLIDSAETLEVGDAAAAFGGDGGPKAPTAITDAGEASCSTSAAAAASAPSQIGGPLIEGTCMALHQAHRKHLDSVVQLMLSAPPSLFPCTAAFCKSVQLYKQQQADGRRSGALLRSETCDGDVRPAFVADASTVPVLASERNENASQRSPAMAQDRGSFVRLLLTRAAGPTIAPNDALRVLLRGFALPELCVYLSEVAAESAVLGVQRSTAMADAELVIGYLQEHAGSVVAPTRAVLFCRDVWLCLQQWMYSEASAERERAAVSRAHHAFSSRTTDSTYSQLSVGIEKGGERRQKQQQQCELEEAPMGWLCRMLLVPKSGVGSHAHGKAAQPKSALPASASNSSALSADASSAAQEAEHYRHALEATLNRKTLSLEVARMIRLYGRSHGGARAIEEIKSIVAAYVRAHINEPAAHVRLTTAAATAAAVATSATLSSSSKHSSFSVRTRSRAQSFRDVVEQHATWNRDGTVDLDATEREFSDRNSIDVIGNEPLFTTPMGFTVLQLAATLGLPEVVAFLVDTYNLNPLYAPAQGMHTCVPQSTTPPPQANRSKEGTRKEEAARVRNVVVHSVRAVVGVASPCAGRGDYGGANGSAGKSREDAGLWICWTPYRLAVRSGNLHIVKTLLLAGSGAAPAVAEINPRELCGTSTLARLSHSDRHVEDGVTFSGAGATVSTAICPAASLVDYKEPAWLDPYQRTALQESIVVATRCGSGASGSDSLVDSLTFTASAGLSSSSVVTKTAPSLSEALALVRLLLKHGAQSNGLFDSTGSDAWLLAMAGSGAADLPITHYSYAADCKRRPYSAGSEASLSQLSLTGASAPATASLALIRTTAGEAAGQRCVDLLRLRAPLLGCAPATLRRADTHLDGRRLDGPQESAESDCFNEQLLRHPRRLLHQWRRLPCMQLAPTRAAAAGFARRGRRAAGTVGNVHDGSGSDEGNDAAGEDGDGAAAQGYSVFEQADALCAQYEKVQQTLHPSAAMAIPRVGGGVRPCTPSPQATALATTVSFASLLTITSAEEVTLLPSAVAPGGAVTLNRRVLAGGSVSRTNSVAGRETGTSPLTPSFSADSLKTRLIAALRLCYRVVLLYTCVEYTPLQLLRLVRAFGAAAIPVSARHPLSGDSVATRLLRKTHAHLLARTSGGGGGGDSSTSNTLRGELGSDAASVMMRGADDMSQLPLSVLKEPPCTDDPAADAETRALVDTCVALVHMLRDAALRLPSPPSAPQSQAAATAAGQALRSVLFQPSCDGETALSLAARIAHAPLISVLVQSGAAVSSASHNRSQGGDESWRCSRTTCSVPWRGDGSDTEAGGEGGVGVYDVSGIPVTSNCSLSTNLADVVVRVLLATRVYYPAHEIGTVRALLTHMPNEPARRAFLRGVYPNIHPLPALQLAMDNVSIASGFLTSPDCMNALWTNLLYAHFTGQLDTAVRTTAKAWSELLHVVLPGAPAVPIYLVMCAAVREEVSAEELKASHSGVRAQSPQVTPSPPQSLAGSTRSSSMVKKRSKERTVPSAIPNWSHVVRRTNLFLQLMAMSAAETLMSKGSKPSSHVSADARTLSSTAAAASGSGQRTKSASSPLHEVTKKGSFAALTDVGEPPLHGLSGTLLWDTIELAVRYDDKDMLRHLLQLRLPDIVLTHIGNIQSQQQTLSSTGTFGRAYSSMDVSARAMEAVSKTILDSYPSFAGVSTTSQATLVLERLQRLLWREALQERHVDLLAVAAGSIETLRFLYTSSPPEVRAQMTPMRYDRVDVKSGMPEGVSPAPDIVAPAAAVPAGAEELLGSFQKLRKSSSARVGSGVMSPSPQVFVVSSKVETHATAAHQLTKTPFSASTASATPSADGVARLAVLTPETPTSPVSPAAKRTSPALAVDIVETPDERSLTLPLADAPLLQPKASEDKEEESAAAVADAELRFMESCVQNGRRRLAPGEERRRCVTAVTWGLGAAACSVKLPMVQSSARAVSASTAGTAEAATAPGTRVEVQPRRTPSLLPQLPRPPAQRRITLDGKIGDVGPVKDSHQAIADGEKTAARQVVQRRGRAKTSLPTKASAAAKEASGPAPSSPTPPAVVEPEPVYFMYLQLDWALHSTRLLRSPRPSSATLETIMFLLDQRVALSVPVLDLFLAGTVAPSSAEAAAPQQHSSDAYARQEVALSLRYQTRAHLDTLLHLLVLHDQCQLAEYYLEYCHFWFVSNELDPEPVSGRPGRFPIGQPPASPDGDSSEDDLNDDDAHLCSDVRYIGHDKQKRSTRSSQQFRHRSRGSSSSAYAGTVPREFLRCMLRVNAHGLTAFDYAHTPAMLQLLEWYGCVPPTYRPNPHAFRRVVFLNRGGHGDVREAYTFADNMDDHDNDEAVDRRQSASVRTSMMARRKREVLRFFPVPRLVLATDNFVALLDPTGTELASTVGSVATAQARTAASGTADGRRCNGEDDADESLAKNEVLVSTRTQPLQLSDRRIDAMISTERRQLQVSERRHHQQERARALLFEQVAAQSQALVTRRGGKSGGADESVRDGALPYLTRAVTAHRRQQWELQRHPPCSKMTLWHNALEAQRLSGSAFTATSSRGRLKRRAEGGARGSNGGGAGVLPILLSEEVSLLHLGLCSFEDELVRLYGELHTASASASAAGNEDTSGAARAHRTVGEEGGAISDGDNAASVLSAYSRLLLPPSVTDKPATHPHQGLEEVKRSYGMMSGDAPPETDKSNSSPRTKASRTGCTVLPRVSFPGGSIGGALSPTQQGNKPSSVSAANAFMAASQDFRSCGRAPALPPRLSQMDVVFLLECQQFVVYPLSMPSTGDAVEVVNDGGDDTYDESSKPRSSAKGGGGLSDSIGNSSRTPSNDEGNVAPPRLSLGKGAASFSELPAVIERCTGGSIGTDEQRVKGAGKDAPRQRAPALATTTRDIAGRSPASPHRSPARREHGDRIRDAPPSDLPLLRSLLARKAADDLSSELIDVSAHRYEAALLVSLTPMLLSGISGDGAPGARVSAAATMRNLAAKLMHTRWKQFGSRPIISGTNTDAATTATEAVALLNVPPFTLADAPALYPSGAPFSASPAADEPGSVASTTALGAAAARVPTVIAARLEEWVARRWPLQRQAPPSPKLHRKAGGRAGTTSSRSPPTKTIKACRQENEDENTQDRNGVDADGYDDESAATSVLDRIEPVGGVATAAQQVLMRALLKRFTAATGAQLSEQMGLVITPNYDVAEVGDTAAALRDIEAKVAAPAAARKKRR
ncbi:Ankyrin repeats (3 copies)/Ankyrin repeat [Leishmania donovani]|uniref:Ankyrin_repeats_(3_copies)/Ankyrin_repeat_putativ e/Pfam:PF12796/Pfam:PF00023 n=1 Tax=Leishmania donovani TaxID=5661 RepID=A0A6J8F9M1_LEIDO|nr:Ankyrin repeats (3 copies)/Ankyrin repeat [Leishmania donovani]VDZ44120.1 Ankyrin_repeats_(3_copies)/Ankyrin_repeat_putative/Pfam:PF12796/Pfam:PF00023 [Leishmania donovani]